jgi:hypothetical protein
MIAVHDSGLGFSDDWDQGVGSITKQNSGSASGMCKRLRGTAYLYVGD